MINPNKFVITNRIWIIRSRNQHPEQPTANYPIQHPTSDGMASGNRRRATRTATAPPLATFPAESSVVRSPPSLPRLGSLSHSFSCRLLNHPQNHPVWNGRRADGQGWFWLCQWLGWLGWLDGFGCGCFGAGRARSFLCAAPSFRPPSPSWSGRGEATPVPA